ncbi:MAG: hypothetical protein PHW18_11605 [Sulfuricurvum sp.]|uniref:hypothetical protein n=1 Tax=Sulfuricurvum sp. TaxID=2025608 RepID=UPI0026205851|nr:hypothetical protein [Sulfuricurvum sp.]MDD2830209.1 hypothetical protein [Sulfuricurvum sp.]MDD4950021.1 hypothetical protein [Sulfuricurvum sp.]
MSTIIMLFVLPLGIIVYFWDRRNYAQSLEMFREYCVQMNHADFSENEKMDRIDEMFYQNGYTRIERDDSRLVVEKKHFNIGVLFICLGALTYFGLFIYLIYYRFFLKARRVIVDLDGKEIMREGKS